MRARAHKRAKGVTSVPVKEARDVSPGSILLGAIVGAFDYDRYDLHISEELKQKVIANCQNDAYKNFGSYSIQRREDIDGWKYFLDDNSWMMIRASGTEPLIRCYIEAKSAKNFRKLRTACEELLRS